MKPYYEHAGITIYHGNRSELLVELSLTRLRNSKADVLITDPRTFVEQAQWITGATHTTMTTKTRLDILREISEDMEADAARFDGQPFTGRTVAEYMACQGAAIQALAKIVETLIISEESRVRNDDQAKPTPRAPQVVEADARTAGSFTGYPCA